MGPPDDSKWADDDLRAHAVTGTELDLSGKPNDQRRVHAEVIYELCTSPLAAVHAKGIRLGGALIEGPLDFEAAALTVPLTLTGCVVGDAGRPDMKAVNLEQASGSWISFDDCQIHGSVSARQVRVASNLSLNGSTVTGPVDLAGADVTGDVEIYRAELTGVDQDGVALFADGLKVGSAFLGDGFKSVGAVRLIGADLNGALAMGGAELTGTDQDGVALFADGLKVGGSVLVGDGFKSVGAVRLAGADITGDLEIGAELTGTDEHGVALFADRLKVGGSAFLGDGFKSVGAVSLAGADITGDLHMVGAELTATDQSGVALFADRLKVGGSAFLGDGFKSVGAVSLAGADITGDLDMVGAVLACTDQDGVGVALGADGLKVGGSAFLGDGFRSVGAVRLGGADITGNLDMGRAELTGTDEHDVTLFADGLKVGGSVFLRSGFKADSTVSLGVARVDGRLDLSYAQEVGSLVLQDARCSEFADSEWSWPGPGLLVVGGFQFGRLDDRLGWEKRLEWVRRQGWTDWSPDPYEQLAAFYARTGDEAAARKIRIFKNRDELTHLKETRKAGTFRYRFWRRPFGWLLGFGYKRWPAGLLLVFTIVAAGVVFRWLNDMDTMVANVSSDVAAQECGKAYPCFNAAVYGADVVLPIIDFGQDSAWRPNSKGNWGSFGQDFRWGLVAVGWVLASIFVAAFTNLVRRE